MGPAPGTVDVWIEKATGDGAWCSDAERKRAARHRHQESAQRWLAARAMVRRIVGGAAGIEPNAVLFGEEAGGKLTLPGTHFGFNVSHTRDLVAVAIAAADVGAVGIDIELPRTLHHPERLGRRLYSSDEHDRWAATPEPARTTDLLQRWTRMEALLKATGDGLRVGITGTERRLLGQGWAVRDLRISPGVGAVAARGEGWQVALHDHTQPNG